MHARLVQFRVFRWPLMCLMAAGLLGGCQKKISAPSDAGGTEVPAQVAGGRNYAEDMQRQKSLAALRSIGIAYMACLTSAPPRDANDLKAYLEGPTRNLVSPRDQQPFVICYGVNPSHLPQPAGETLIAWEATADSMGGRCGLYADGRAVYLPSSEFDQATKAKSD
ncbi:MAG TPA: hypothetical protein PKD86_02740 [Gemmatales bacterium]|nr:hypothetical protein [Gemmatales bacterium]HMP58248.1 hypothetical protein [Gemmatales bacterium]